MISPFFIATLREPSVNMKDLEALTLVEPPRDKLFNSPSPLSLFIWVQDWVKTEFQFEALTLIHSITENRTRHARGPVQNISSVTFIHSLVSGKVVSWAREKLHVVFPEA